MAAVRFAPRLPSTAPRAHAVRVNGLVYWPVSGD